MTVKYFCAHCFCSTTITREDFEKITPNGFGVRVGGSRRALKTHDWVSFDTWEEARDHLLAYAKRELKGVRSTIETLEKLRDPYSLVGGRCQSWRWNGHPGDFCVCGVPKNGHP